MALLKITINTDSSAFDGQPELEIERILKDIAQGIGSGRIDEAQPIRDINGNTIGQLTLDEEE